MQDSANDRPFPLKTMVQHIEAGRKFKAIDRPPGMVIGSVQKQWSKNFSWTAAPMVSTVQR